MFRLPTYGRLLLISTIVIALSGCGHSKPDIHGGNASPVRVKVMSASPMTAAAAEGFSGTIEAGSTTTPSFSVTGTITKINVAEGDRVSKGQLIATLDGASLKDAYEVAQAGLREAQDAYARMKKLHDAKALPDMQWVSVQEKLKQAEATASMARTGMNDANLYAPISGVVSAKLADVGQNVGPGVPVVELMDVATLKAKITVPESDLRSLKVGSAATVRAAGKSYPARLSDKGVAANNLSRNYDIKFVITKPDDNLLPGMICTVDVEGAARDSASTSHAEIVLPPQAVVLDFDNNSYVWLVKDGTAQRRPVTTGGLDSRGIIVTAGLLPTDSVIVEGQQKLSSGLKVTAVN